VGESKIKAIRHRSRGDQRGICSAVSRCGKTPRIRSRQSEREWRCYRARPSAGRNRHAIGDDRPLRIAPPQQKVWACRRMYRRGAGNCDDCGGNLMVIKRVGVLGCGLMGSGIAQVSAGAGYSTVVKEVADDFLKKGFSSIEKSLGKFVEKGTITADQRTET